MTSKIKTTLMIVVFIVGISMVVVGQKSLGYQGLTIQLIGLIGLLVDLCIYNKDHK